MANVMPKLKLNLKKCILWCTDFFSLNNLNTPVNFQIKTEINRQKY